MKRILLTGASGLLGLNFGLQVFDQYEVIGLVNQNALGQIPFEIRQVDLAQPGAVLKIIDQVKPDVIIHCAAIANIDQCENMPDLAQKINAEVPGEFAKISKEKGIRLVHISTDAVYDGQKGNYTETDATNPLSVYAKTKLNAEKFVSTENDHAIIARVNFYGWSLSGKRSLSEFFFNNLFNGKEIMGFTDVYFCPLLVNDLVDLLLEMIQKNLYGLYNVVSSTSLTKYDFGVAIANYFGLNSELIKPVSVYEGGLKAARSPNLTLSVKKLETALGHDLSDPNNGLDRYYALYQSGYREKIQSFYRG